MQEKRKYFVSVETGQILEEQGAAAYELEIEVTPEERTEIEKLFAKKNNENIDLFVDVHFPFLWDEVEGDVASYNQYMASIYKLLHKYGTQETKQFIEENQIIQKLEGDWQDYDFS